MRSLGRRRALPSRPSVPVLAGVMLRVTAGQLRVSGFDYEVSSQVTVEVHGDADGAALVSGRLLAEITKALPRQAGRDRRRRQPPRAGLRQRPVHPPDDAGRGLPDAAGDAGDRGHHRRRDVRDRRRQVAIAAGRDETLPLMTGVRMEIEGETLALLATDRYRLALREIAWRPRRPAGPSAGAGAGPDARRHRQDARRRSAAR